MLRVPRCGVRLALAVRRALPQPVASGGLLALLIRAAPAPAHAAVDRAAREDRDGESPGGCGLWAHLGYVAYFFGYSRCSRTDRVILQDIRGSLAAAARCEGARQHTQRSPCVGGTQPAGQDPPAARGVCEVTPCLRSLSNGRRAAAGPLPPVSRGRGDGARVTAPHRPCPYAGHGGTPPFLERGAGGGAHVVEPVGWRVRHRDGGGRHHHARRPGEPRCGPAGGWRRGGGGLGGAAAGA
mmetsp:Transcript_2411/g.6013  ORF Transcript_2411/g.6013 Transcript_2411/m.6013 type:complete len:240 (+) Transcript_2411:1062-1781(+)